MKKVSIYVVLSVAVLCVPMLAQDRDVFFNSMVPPPPGVGPMQTSVFINTEVAGPNKLVKNAPYSAQAVSETTQVLADGNRIVNKTTTNVFRDSQGRTRREVTFGPQHQQIFINDPASNVNYVLDPATKTAQKLTMRVERFGGPEGAAGGVVAGSEGAVRSGGATIRMEHAGPLPGGDVNVMYEAVGPGPGTVMVHKEVREVFGPDSKEPPKTEALGSQNIEGVEAQGKRTTITIPAGRIGNEQPIEIVSETWYSPKLQAVVLSRNHDPRFGDTTYRLTNISLDEPSATLFQLPSDYTVNEEKPMKIFFKHDAPAN